MGKRIQVAILGGGIGGLSAAHELVEIGGDFEIHVYEASDEIGGKARSQFMTGTGGGGRLDLPGEHGFRFFPAFYKHIPDTLARIPRPRGGTVADNLVGCSEMAMAEYDDRQPHRFFRHRPSTAGELFNMLGTSLLFFESSAVPESDYVRFARTMFDYLLTCDERRRAQCEDVSFFQFIEAERYTERFQAYLNSSRFMVAMDIRRGSACTIANKVLQILRDFLRPKGENDRVLNGPTKTAWLDPWKTYLRDRGVVFHFGRGAERLIVDRTERLIKAARIGGDTVEADYFVAALPIERMKSLIDEDVAWLDESLRKLRDKADTMTDWMAGAQYFLRVDVPICDGHVAFPDSPWALSAISQASFWNRHRPESEQFRMTYGDGSAGGVLSIDISDWNTPSPRTGKSAKQCTSPDEVLDEVWAQLKERLNGEGRILLDDANLVARHLDAHVHFSERGAGNTAPLLVHPPGSFHHRPEATLDGTGNLILAADYVRTETDLASMEGANEAARRAVNGILAREGMGKRAVTFPMTEEAGPRVAKAKARDRHWWVEKGRAAPLLVRLPLFRDEDEPAREEVERYQEEMGKALDALPDGG